ncbi:spore germination protein [Bacillus timonensis]|nr:spore germination protein [Bacillus timonensis]
MKQQTDKLGIREFVAIILLMFGVKLTDDTPAILYDSVQNAAWMVPLISTSIIIIPLYLYLKVLTTYNDKNLHDINLHLFGKYIGNVISLSFWVLGTAAIVIDTRVYVDIIGTLYFTRTPTIVIYGLLMLVCAYSAQKGIQNIGSVAWMVIVYVKITLLLAMILTLIDGNLYAIFPILGPGTWEIVKEGSLKISIFGDILYLGLFLPLMRSKKDFSKGTWIALTIVTIELSASLLIFVMLFDYPSVEMLNYPFHTTIRYISIGDFLTNIETFFFPFWLIATFIRFSTYVYLTSVLFSNIFQVNKFEFVVPAIATIVVLLGNIPETPTFTMYKLRENLLHFFSPLFIGFPLLLWLTALLKGEFKHAKKQK